MDRSKDVDAYLAGFPEKTRQVLELVRDAIRRALPEADEVMSYRIPAYRLPGGVALFFAGWKRHWSLYPAGADLITAFREELAPYEFNAKGTIRFPLEMPVPADLVEKIAAFRRAELG